MDLVASLSDESISNLGDLPICSLDPSQTVLDAIDLMRQTRTGCVVACRDGKPVGVITERDVLRRLGTSLPLDVPISEAMTNAVWTVRQSDSLAMAIRIMTDKHCRHLVVVSDSGKATGILSVKRIVHDIVEHFPSSVYNLPPVANKNPDTPEGA